MRKTEKFTPDTFYRLSKEMAYRVFEENKGKGFVYLPMETGGFVIGKPFEHSLEALAPVRTYPVRRNREERQIIAPSVDEVKYGVGEIRREASGVIALGYDDAIGTGLDILILYNWLLEHEKTLKIDGIKLASAFDFLGITDYTCMPFYQTRVNREEYLEKMRKSELGEELGNPINDGDSPMIAINRAVLEKSSKEIRDLGRRLRSIKPLE